MKRYQVSQFDSNTYIVLDTDANREICICGNYQRWNEAEERAQQIATLLNEHLKRAKTKSRKSVARRERKLRK